MKPKKIYTIVYIIITIIVSTFFVVWYITSKNPKLSFITYISGISSFFVALLTALNVYTTTSQIEVATKQLDEMKYERSMLEQPLLLIENMKFLIEKPRFFYTPPEDEYSFQSRYTLTMEIQNCSNYPAISVDTTSELHVPKEREVYSLSTVTRRNNIIAPGNKKKIAVRFTGDEITLLFDSLREDKAENLPKTHFDVTYKNLSGGFFKAEGNALLIPNKSDLNTIREWHSRINAAYIEEKESIIKLRKIRGEEEWDTLFSEIKSSFDASLSDCESVEVRCAEIPESFSVGVISDEEYNEACSNHHYSHFVHHEPNCIEKSNKKK